MTTAWLPFLIGMTTGSVLAWFLSTIPVHSRTPSTEGRTVAAIASRIELEEATVAGHACARPYTPGIGEWTCFNELTHPRLGRDLNQT